MERALAVLAFSLAAVVPVIYGVGVGGTSFRNLSDREMMLYWAHPQTGAFKHQARLCANGCSTGFQTYAGHRFAWAEMVDGNEPRPSEIVPVHWSQVDEGQLIYAFIDETTKPAVRELLEDEFKFRAEYLETNGFPWTGTAYPRPPPTLPLVPASFVGQQYLVALDDPLAQFWNCETAAAKSRPADEDITVTNTDYVSECLRDGKQPDMNKLVRGGPSNLTLRVASVKPRVFQVENFLSDFEADYIIAQAKPNLRRSTVGHGINAKVDNTRTSKQTWLSRSHSEIMDAIYRRVALVTGVPEELLHEGKNVESMNVLNYPKGGEYTPHYDWGPNGKVNSRFLSGLLYLNTPHAGGGTSFPKAVNDGKKTGITIPAAKGSYVFFYDLLEDGNGDVLSLHAGDPVQGGHKWIAPLWIWEPSSSGRPHSMGDLSQRKINTIPAHAGDHKQTAQSEL